MGCGASTLRAPAAGDGGHDGVRTVVDTEQSPAAQPQVAASTSDAHESPHDSQHNQHGGGKQEAAAASGEKQDSSSCRDDVDGRHDETQASAAGRDKTGASQPGLADLGKVLRAQMEAGFRRRKEAFVREIFNKHSAGEGEAAGISQQRLAAALQDLGINVSASDAKELFYMQDINKDGLISWPEFLHMSKTASTLGEWASNLPLAELLADCIPPAAMFPGAQDNSVRAVSCLTADHIQVIATCFGEGVAVLLTEQVDTLERAFACMDQKMEEIKRRQEVAAGKSMLLYFDRWPSPYSLF
jgi:hypothetical protein